MAALLELNNVTKEYRRGRHVVVSALKNVSIQIEAGELIAIVGKSGSGKSTLLNMIGALDKPSSGSIMFEGRRVDSYNDSQLSNHRNQNIGFVFQAYNLMPYLTVLQNIELPLIIRGSGPVEREQAAYNLAKEVDLADRLDHIPSELSGGQMQRVAIARALASKPKLVLADEPTGNLDAKTGEQIMDLLIKMNKELGTTVVIVTHDEDLAKKAQRVIHISDGEIVNA